MASWTDGVLATPLLGGLPLAPKSRRAAKSGSPVAVRVTESSTCAVASMWPCSTDGLCWHCCHAFDGPPLPLPFKHDERRDVFHVCGTFCSWECMKSHNWSSNSHLAPLRGMLITLMRKRCTGLLGNIRPAPPRESLRAFGGWMTIEEFRGCDAVYDMVPPRMIMHPPRVEQVPIHRRPHVTVKQLDQSVSFHDATAQNEMLRLRRSKPLTNHNLLVKAMGVSILNKKMTG